jgi:hypothetical protein
MAAFGSTVTQQNNAGFSGPLVSANKHSRREGLERLTMTHPSLTRERVWVACRRARDVRLRARDHRIFLGLDGQSCPEMAQWLSRDEETIRGGVHAVNPAGLPGRERDPIPGRPT